MESLSEASTLAIQPAACMSIAMGSAPGHRFSRGGRLGRGYSHFFPSCWRGKGGQACLDRESICPVPGMLRDVGESGLDLVKMTKRGGMPDGLEKLVELTRLLGGLLTERKGGVQSNLQQEMRQVTCLNLLKQETDRSLRVPSGWQPPWRCSRCR